MHKLKVIPALEVKGVVVAVMKRENMFAATMIVPRETVPQGGIVPSLVASGVLVVVIMNALLAIVMQVFVVNQDQIGPLVRAIASVLQDIVATVSASNHREGTGVVQ